MGAAPAPPPGIPITTTPEAGHRAPLASRLIPFLRSHAAELIALGALALALLPLLATPRVSDDVINYSFRWLAPSEFVHETLKEIRFWMLSAGRVFVLSSVLKNIVFAVFETTHAYKVFLIATNLACAACFLYYASIVSPSRLVPVAAVLSLPFLIQFRDYHDPVISFNGIFQISVGLIFLALAFHMRYLRSGEARWLWRCLALFVANLLVYELAALTVVFVWLQSRTMASTVPGAQRGTRLLLVTLALYGAAVIVLRLVGSKLYGIGASRYGVALDPWPVFITFAKQLIAVAPFSYFIFRPQYNGAWGVHASPDRATWFASGFFYAGIALFLGLAWVAMRRATEERPKGEPRREAITATACVAVAMVLLPALLVSVISRYQNAFLPGNGYSFVYLQEYGAALFIGLILHLVRKGPAPARLWAGIAFCLMAAVASAGNLVNNLAVAAKLREAWGDQHAFWAMLRSEGFRETCRGVPLQVSEPKPWTEYRVIRHAGFRLAESDERGEVCLVRGLRIGDRVATTYERGPDVRVVVPLAGAEAGLEKALYGACGGRPAKLQTFGEMGETRYGVFACDREETRRR